MSFVHNAIQFQQDAETIHAAKKSLSISCALCSEHGIMSCDCDTCPVQHAHNARLETLKTIELLNQERRSLV